MAAPYKNDLSYFVIVLYYFMIYNTEERLFLLVSKDKI